MKRLLSLLILVVFVLMLFPLSVFATSAESEGQNYRVRNINDLICVYEDSECSVYDWDFIIYDSVGDSQVLSSQQVFMTIVLRVAGVSQNDIIYDDLQLWQFHYYTWISSGNVDSLFWDSIDEFIRSSIVYGVKKEASRFVFSSEFLNELTRMIRVWNFVSEIDIENPFVAFDDFSSVQWNLDEDVYCLCIGTSPSTNHRAHAFYIDVFVNGFYDLDLYEIWDILLATINASVFTSWLPPILAAPIVRWWGLFISLCLVLIGLKILHG